MSTTARLARRNLWRSPRRTLLTMSAVIAGVAVIILGRGFVEGTSESIIVGAIDGTVGHVSARPAGYPTRALQHPVDELLTLTSEARRLLDDEAAAWTERTFFSPLVAHGRDSLRVVAIGFDDERDLRVFPRELWRVDGAMPRAGQREVGVSPSVASLLGLEPGARVTLQVRTHPGALNAMEVTVSGVVNTGNIALDMRGVWVPAALTEELLVAEAPSHVAVKLASRGRAADFAERLQAALGEQAEVITWESETAELIALQEVRMASLNMVVFVLLALAAFGIANTVLMAAHERVREIGTLRSMGMTERGVVGLFLLEGALIGLAGGLLGALLGGGATLYWSSHPIDFSEVMKAQGASYSISPLIYTHFEWPVIVVAILLGVVVAALASIYPARVASRMVPADAVRADA